LSRWQVTKEFADGFTEEWMFLVWCDFGQRYQDESALVKLGMRDGQKLAFHHDGVVEEQVQIHGTGTLGHRSFPVEYVRLYPLQVGEKLVRSKGRFETDYRVQKRVLGYGADRIRVIEARQGSYPGFRDLADFGDCSEEVQFPVAEVRAETNVGYEFHGFE
jgi:hypothetical protein